jgi:hypothetical protein
MSTEPTRSEQTISEFKQRKLTRSALHRIQELIQSFEDDRAFDWRLARIGVLVVAVLVAVSFYLLFSGNSITLLQG